MFNPTRDQVRQFFCDVRRKAREGLPLVGAELTAIDIVLAHPEYHALLDEPERALGMDWTPIQGETNPFLHMAMHLAIEEQRSIDQPRGVANALAELEARTADPHAARHAAIECLGEMMWTAQRAGTPPDAERYLDCLRRAR